MTIEEKLNQMGIILPPAASPAGAYIPTVQSGSLLFVSGQLPIRDGKVIYRGKVAHEKDIPNAQQAARLAVINALAALDKKLETLTKVQQIIRLEVFVNSGPGFTDQAQVANGASQLLHRLFDSPGRHTRIAVGVAELPLDAMVELALIVEIKP